MPFQKATKGKKPVRLVMGGPSGSGKTYTALVFAKYLETITKKPTAAVDTEHYRMSLYADKFDFDVDNREPPFDPRQLVKTIHDAEKDGYGQLIVDSSTHYYSGPGGLLEIVNDAAKSKYGGNIYAGWAVGTPIQNDLIDAVIRSSLHIIFCTRAKEGYVEGEKNGRKVYEKSGMELQQRDNFQFDFDFVIMMDMENNGTVEKGMGYLPTGEYVKKPDVKVIEKIMKSINENTTEELAVPPVKFEKPSPEEIMKATKAKIIEIVKLLGGQVNLPLMALLKSYEENTGNPNKMKDQSKLDELLEKVTIMNNEKEIK